MRTFLRTLTVLVLTLLVAVPARADVTEVRVARQPGLLYLPLMIMEENKLLEKHAAQLGVSGLKTSWITFNSGGAAVDALLSGSVDFITSGPTNLLVAWSATNGQVKGVGGAGALPMWLMTRNPNVHSLKDFTNADKIAVPTVRVSTQATILQLAVEKEFGPNETHKLDPITIALGHPDAMIALASGKSEVDSHFSLPPYEQQEAKLPGVHKILSSFDVANGPVSNGVSFATTKFHDANPKIMAAFLAALGESINVIRYNKRAAAQIYLDQTHDKLTIDEIVAMLNDKQFVYSLAPRQTLKLAELMYRAGSIKKKAENWKDYFFPEVYSQGGT